VVHVRAFFRKGHVLTAEEKREDREAARQRRAEKAAFREARNKEAIRLARVKGRQKARGGGGLSGVMGSLSSVSKEAKSSGIGGMPDMFGSSKRGKDDLDFF
jgi:hypothetical protein